MYDPEAPDILLVRHNADGTERIEPDDHVPVITPVGKCPGVPHRGHTDPLMVCPMNVRNPPLQGVPIGTYGGASVVTDPTLPLGAPMQMFGDARPASDYQIEQIEMTPEEDAQRLHEQIARDREKSTIIIRDLERERDELLREREYTPTVADWGRLVTAERQRDILGDELRAMRISEQADKRRMTELDRELSVVTADYARYREESRKMMRDHDKAVGELRTTEAKLELAIERIRNLRLAMAERDARIDEMVREYNQVTAEFDKVTTELGERITEIGELTAQLRNVPGNGFIIGGVAVPGKQCANRMESHWPHVWGPPGTAVWHRDHARYCAGVRGASV